MYLIIQHNIWIESKNEAVRGAFIGHKGLFEQPNDLKAKGELVSPEPLP
jgi:hypothetical protein